MGKALTAGRTPDGDGWRDGCAGTEAVVAWIGGRIDLLCARLRRYVDVEE
jgi:hypothetical protein